jgi:hypothetical protein
MFAGASRGLINAAGNLVYSSYIAGNPASTNIENTEVQIVSLQSVTVTGNRFADPQFPVTDRTYEQDACTFLATFNITATSGPASLVYSGCTPINITDNLIHEAFRGTLYFGGSTTHLDPNRNLYGLSQSGQTSANAFQKAPPNPFSGDGETHVWLGKLNINLAGPRGINLSGPYQSGPPFSNPVLFRLRPEARNVPRESPPCASIFLPACG